MTEAPRPVPPLLIRTAVAAEAADLAALHHRARSTYHPQGLPDDGFDWPARWRTAIGRRDGHVLCAVREGRAVALASFRTPDGGAPDTVELFQFHVDPEHWGRGTGSALHAACVRQWRDDGRRTAVLSVHTGNVRAREFYAHRGWTPDPDHPHAGGDHHLRLRLGVPGNEEG